MYILNGNIVIRKDDDAINVSGNEKILKESLIDFPEFQKQEESILIFSHSNKALIITSNQITYALNGDVEDISIPKIVDWLSTANYILDLDNEAGLIINLEVITNISGNSLEKTLNQDNKNAVKLDAIGVGKRYIVENETITGNIFIEPYLEDDSKVYMRIQLESNEKVAQEEWNSLFSEMIGYIDKTREVVDSLYN